MRKRSRARVGNKGRRARKRVVEPTILTIGMPGLPLNFTMLHSAQDIKETGNPGAYRVVFTLGKPGQRLRAADTIGPHENVSGESHLAIAAPAYKLPDLDPRAKGMTWEVGDEKGSLLVYVQPDAAGTAGKLVLPKLQAKGFADAGRFAYRAIGRPLSTLSVFLDIPLFVEQIDITELSTNVRQFTCVVPHLVTPIRSMPAETMTAEFAFLAGIYREGLNSNSSVFQFLCFYKVLEGFISLNTKRRRDAEAAGLEQRSPKNEKVPTDKETQRAWLRAVYLVSHSWIEGDLALETIFLPEAVGQTTRKIFTDSLRPLRLRVAHGLFESEGTSLDTNLLEETAKVEKWVPLTRILCRVALKNEYPEFFGMPRVEDVDLNLPPMSVNAMGTIPDC